MSITLKELTIQEVEFMIAALSKGEYSLVAPLIEKIKVQAIPQAHAIMQAEADAKAQEIVENGEKATEEPK
jgi:3-deoxy-D-manno-octulosonic-acid transferase